MNFQLRQMKIGIAFRVANIGLASFMLASASAQTFLSTARSRFGLGRQLGVDMKSWISRYTIATTCMLLAFGIFAPTGAAAAQDISFKSTNLERIDIPSSSCTGFWRTPSFTCTKITIPAFMARAKDGSYTALVIINGNAGGIDRRHGDYARFLADNNINAVVLDSFRARGHNGGVGSNANYYRSKGLDGFNMSIDAVTVATEFGSRTEWAEAKIGYLGESMSGASAINVTRPYIGKIVDQQSGKHRDFDAVASLYPACYEKSTADEFKNIPFLLVQPEKDDITPAALCKQQTEWMNGRGGNVKYVGLAGEYHDFDAPWALKHMTSNNTSKCAYTRMGDKFVMDDSKKEYPGTPEGYSDLREQCKTNGFTSGNRGEDRVGYSIWLEFFQSKLLGQTSAAQQQ
jgi:dienelactone hydrolase